MRFAFVIVFSLLGSQSFAFSDPPLESWISIQHKHACERILAAISPPNAEPGAVIASPTPHYYYHWIRDAALVMLELGREVDLYSSLDHALLSRDKKEEVLKLYIRFSRKIQRTDNLSGPSDHTGPGEPKFHMDGKPFMGDWGRPQSDGPAARVLSLLPYALSLYARGEKNQLLHHLYDGKIPTHGLIKADLEYIAHHWKDSTFDLWEEVKGHHFYTLMLHRRALWEGSKLAHALNDDAAADFYLLQVDAIEKRLQQFWDPSRGYTVATLDRNGGLDTKHSGIDVAVALGFLYGEIPERPLFAINSDRALATYEHLRLAFNNVPLNHHVVEGWDHRPLENGIGRYPEDTYRGDGGSGPAHMWFLATAALAEVHYKSVHAFSAAGEITVTQENHSFFIHAIKRIENAPEIAIGLRLTPQDPRFYQLLTALHRVGDGYLRRIREHAGRNGSMAEQFDRETGHERSVSDLTWSYASALAAFRAREKSLMNLTR